MLYFRDMSQIKINNIMTEFLPYYNSTLLARENTPTTKHSVIIYFSLFKFIKFTFGIHQD